MPPPPPRPGDALGRDDDDTVRLPPPPPPRRRRAWLAGLLAAAGGLGLAVRLLWPAPLPVPVPSPAPPPGVAALFALGVADEAAILADAAPDLTLFRFAAEPRIVVLDFASLEQQGRTFNRVAALVEKAGLPRDRVLGDAELDAAIRASGDTPATYYYGHDYPAADLARFFALAGRDHVALDPEEERLRALLGQLGWLAPGSPPPGALLSLSHQGTSAELTPAARAVILHHELSHGAFFTVPAYADYTRAFWQTALTEAERAAIRKFLADAGYDSSDETLMLNEMQAYLMFTDDAHFFEPSSIGMTVARRAALRDAFRRDLPLDWLRQAMAPPPGILPQVAPVISASAPHRRAAGPH